VDDDDDDDDKNNNNNYYYYNTVNKRAEVRNFSVLVNIKEPSRKVAASTVVYRA